MMKKSVILATYLSISPPSFAQCNQHEFKQFDFWLGHWHVYTPDKKHTGWNTITKSHDGCVITEKYTTKTGFSGESLNIFDATRGKWHQTWVDNTGLLLVLEGTLENDSMILSGERQNGNGRISTERIIWTPYADGSVRQLWQKRDSENQPWKTVFQGLYKKAPAN